MNNEGFAVEADDLSCTLNGHQVFGHLQLQMPEGALVGVFGPNGAGKTTLFRALLGLVPARFAQLRLLGTELRTARRQIGYVSQRESAETEGRLSAATYVAAAWRGERWGWSGSRAARRQAVHDALAQVGAVQLAGLSLGKMSGGQRQRVRIAQVLVNPPRMLLLDEPLNNLDPQSQQSLLQLAHRFCREQGMTVLINAHDINPLLPYMDNVLYLANGGGRFGSVDDLLHTPMLSELYGAPVRVVEHDGMVSIRVDTGFVAEQHHHCGEHAHV
ncbi:MAG: ATP-binding cassette domain-containing protein [Acidihalobacter sp.]|uniref:metal ABC transporter ATP-binding protein n=1 Tax=Acidihalobacter sp. TaxID=1872108 RepID=UPI00307F6B4A